MMRRIDPLLREHRIGRDNLRAAFRKSRAREIERILQGVWERNAGPCGAGVCPHRQTVGLGPGPSYDRTDHGSSVCPLRFARRSIATGKPMLCFAAHLANWEMPAVVCHKLGIKSAVLYRRPNLSAVADAVVDIRTGCMGTLVPAGLSAPLKLREAMQDKSQIGLLVDQDLRARRAGGTFFGRPTRANPLLARLARQHECGVGFHGIRAIRHPGNRFEITVTEPIPPVREDTKAHRRPRSTMQAIWPSGHGGRRRNRLRHRDLETIARMANIADAMETKRAAPVDAPAARAGSPGVGRPKNSFTGTPRT